MDYGNERSWPGWNGEREQEVGYANFAPASVSLPANYSPSLGALNTSMVNTPQDDFTTYASDHALGAGLTNWLENLNPGEFMPAPNSMSYAETKLSISPTLFLPNSAPPECHTSRRTSREAWSPEEDSFLVARRKEGRGFLQIAQELSARFGGPLRSNNCLIKRLQKIQGRYLEPLPMAMKNGMPKVIAILKDEMDKLDLDGVSEEDKEALNEVLQDLPRLLPNYLQNRVTNARKALLNTSLGRT